MLEIGGKTLLDHQLDVLRSVGIRNIHVVVGYQKEKVAAKGIEIVENAFFNSQRSAYSVLCGLSKVKGKTLITYSDIIFDRQIPEALLKSPFPITLIIDRAFRTLPRRDKSLDLVIISDAMEKENLESRRLQVTNFKRIIRIGKKIDNQAASHEFIGMFLLTKEGLEIIRDAWEEARKTSGKKPFYEAPNIDQASTTDLIQFMIDRDIEVHGLVIEHGWSEIYSLGDYERLNRYFCEKTKDLAPQT
jgi:choline kinase